MRRLPFFNHLCLFVLATSLFSLASIDSSSAGTPRIAHLNCAGSGETSGFHPGWSSSSAQQLTFTYVSTANYILYWCPAAAPNGQGVISYTVTSSLGAITCETVALSCALKGISPSSNFSLMASDETGSYNSNQIAIQNSGIPVSCIKAPMKCNLGPGIQSYPTFGNMAPVGLGSCTFAAVANWEEIALGLHADPVVVSKQFNAAGGTANLGLTTDQVFNYWRTFGVAGVFLQGATTIPVDPVNVQRSIDDTSTRVLIASLNLAKNQNFAGTTNPNSSYHWVVVSGYTPQGPLVISWGRTLQMTWQQWNFEAVTTWKIETGNSLKSLKAES